MRVSNHRLIGEMVSYRETENMGGVKTPLYIVAHFDAAGNSTSAVNWLTQKGSGVSADLHITKTSKVTQMAPFNRVTWHAGVSEYKGLKSLNNHSIGIEMENQGKVKGVYEDYPKVQIEKFIEVSKALVKAYPTIREIVGHDQIAMPRGRKDDPGPKFPLAEVNRRVFGGKSSDDNKLSSKKVTASGLNLRSSPNSSNKNNIVSVLTNGTEVMVLKEESGWSEVVVCSSKLRGWVSSKWIS